VDLTQASRQARQRLEQWRAGISDSQWQSQCEAVRLRHASRRRPASQTREASAAAAGQFELDF